MQVLAKIKLSKPYRCLNLFMYFPKYVNTYCTCAPIVAMTAEKIVKTINDNPFSGSSLNNLLSQYIPPSQLSATLIEEVLIGFFTTHSNGVNALDFFNYCLRHSPAHVTPYAFDKTLHILVRMNHLAMAWELMEDIGHTNPSFLTVKSMSLLLMKVAKSGSYEDTIDAFNRMEKGAFAGRVFGTDEFNSLLLALCTHRPMNEVQSVFLRFHSRFRADTKTMNILLLGFKKTGNITSVELFFHEMVHRGFTPDSVTYNIRIHALCKRGEFEKGLRLFHEMGREGCPPTVETITTLVHGGGMVHRISKSRELFGEMQKNMLKPDTRVYNALISSVIRERDMGSAARLMEEMEEKGIEFDDMTYHTMLFGLIKRGKTKAVCEVYCRMIKRDWVPGATSVVMLMRFFCRNREVEWGLGLWRHLIHKGRCPHPNTFHLLVVSLCARGRTEDAVNCSRQMLERGRCFAPATCRLLEMFLVRAGVPEQWKLLDEGVKKLQAVTLMRRSHSDHAL